MDLSELKDKKIQELEELMEIKDSKEVVLNDLEKVKIQLIVEQKHYRNVQHQNMITSLQLKRNIENIQNTEAKIMHTSQHRRDDIIKDSGQTAEPLAAPEELSSLPTQQRISALSTLQQTHCNADTSPPAQITGRKLQS